MKNWVILLSFQLFVVSCISTEVLGIESTIMTAIDTTTKSKPHKPPRPPDPPKDTTERQDTARVPIGWNPSVGDWDEKNITNL